MEAKSDVCKVTGIVFPCRQDAGNFKNICYCFWGENNCFQLKMAILMSFQLPIANCIQSVNIGYFYPPKYISK